MDRYRKGYRNEKKSIAYMAKSGYLPVAESRGSHGVWDLVFINALTRTVVFVQVKSNKPPSKKEMVLMRDYPRPYGGVKQIHVWHDRNKMPEIIEVQ